MRRLFLTLAVVALLSVAAYAQPRPGTATPQTTPRPVATPATTAPATPAVVPATKIGFVNTEAFGDETVGIKKYVNAVKSVQAGFQARSQELVTIDNRMKAIADEINKLSSSAAPVSQETIRAKNEEGERLQRDLKYKQESLQSDYQKKYDEVVRPISADIGKALDQYMLSHSLTMILDISKLAPAVLSLNPATDITKDFIAEYNAKNP
jgi:Skp family chaperone for outer membrane proteins